jgi:hypothetical protein
MEGTEVVPLPAMLHDTTKVKMFPEGYKVGIKAGYEY